MQRAKGDRAHVARTASALRRACFGVESGRHVDGDNGDAGLVQQLDEPHAGLRKRAVQPDAEESVHDEVGAGGQSFAEAWEGVFWFRGVNEGGAARQSVPERGAGVAPVVALPGYDQDFLFRRGKLKQLLGDSGRGT